MLAHLGCSSQEKHCGENHGIYGSMDCHFGHFDHFVLGSRARLDQNLFQRLFSLSNISPSAPEHSDWMLAWQDQNIFRRRSSIKKCIHLGSRAHQSKVTRLGLSGEAQDGVSRCLHGSMGFPAISAISAISSISSSVRAQD